LTRADAFPPTRRGPTPAGSTIHVAGLAGSAAVGRAVAVTEGVAGRDVAGDTEVVDVIVFGAIDVVGAVEVGRRLTPVGLVAPAVDGVEFAQPARKPTTVSAASNPAARTIGWRKEWSVTEQTLG